jgi:excisionase family DNA binding protein
MAEPSQYLMTTDEVAALVRVPASSVGFWRHAGKGPRSFKLGRRILYDASDVHAWIEAERERQSYGVA